MSHTYITYMYTSNLYLADFFWKTKFAVMWLKRPQKAGFLSPRSSKITVTKEKPKKGKKEIARSREKSNGWTLRFYNGYFGHKKLLDGNVHSAVTFSKIYPGCQRVFSLLCAEKFLPQTTAFLSKTFQKLYSVHVRNNLWEKDNHMSEFIQIWALFLGAIYTRWDLSLDSLFIM